MSEKAKISIQANNNRSRSNASKASGVSLSLPAVSVMEQKKELMDNMGLAQLKNAAVNHIENHPTSLKIIQPDKNIADHRGAGHLITTFKQPETYRANLPEFNNSDFGVLQKKIKHLQRHGLDLDQQIPGHPPFFNNNINKGTVQAVFERGSGWGWPTWNTGGYDAWEYLKVNFPNFISLIGDLDNLKDTHGPLTEDHKTKRKEFDTVTAHNEVPIVYADGIQLHKDLPEIIKKVKALSIEIKKNHTDIIDQQIIDVTKANDNLVKLETEFSGGFLHRYAKPKEIKEGTEEVDTQKERLKGLSKKLLPKKVRLDSDDLELIKDVGTETTKIKNAWSARFVLAAERGTLISELVEEAKGGKTDLNQKWINNKTEEWDKGIEKMGVSTTEIQTFRKSGFTGEELKKALLIVSKIELTDLLTKAGKDILLTLLTLAGKGNFKVAEKLLTFVPVDEQDRLTALLVTKKIAISDLYDYLETEAAPIKKIETAMVHCNASQLKSLIVYGKIGISGAKVEDALDNINTALGKLNNSASLLLQLMNTHSGCNAATMMRIVGAHLSTGLWDISVSDIPTILYHYKKHVIDEGGGGGPGSTNVEKFSADAVHPTNNWKNGKISSKGDAWTIRAYGKPGGTYNLKTKKPMTFWYI